MSRHDPTTVRPRRPPPSETDFFRWIKAANDDAESARRSAMALVDAFDTFYFNMRAIPQQAKAAFEEARWADQLYLSHKRLRYYSRAIRQFAMRLKAALPGLAESAHLWSAVEPVYLADIAGRYEQDLAIAFMHSVRRVIYSGSNWQPVDYSYRTAARQVDWLDRSSHIVRLFPAAREVTPATIDEIMDIPAFSARFRSRAQDCAACANRLNERFGLGTRHPGYQELKMLNAGFYRNRGAYIVGQIVLADRSSHPLILSLENGRSGIFVDAVLTTEADAHNLFSSTLANFHVTNTRYHELCAFLHRIMPGRPLGLHYSTIGYNHIGKVAVFEEIGRELEAGGQVLDIAPGFEGSVAMGFSAPQSRYVLKVIRDTPAEHYKWETWPGVEAVISKYRQVHEISRTGSMLDNIVYQHAALPRRWFEPALLDKLTAIAPDTVRQKGDQVHLAHLIVQPRLIPVPLYLENASEENARTAIISLGNCIRNNAAANIFNRDLDARNYGVNPYGKVYLFDYDAVEPLTDIKVRTNADREDGEEDIPSWFFEDGTIFLPEEMLPGLRIEDRQLRRLFQDTHTELLTTGYWEGMQRALRRDLVPKLTVYPDACKLPPPA